MAIPSRSPVLPPAAGVGLRVVPPGKLLGLLLPLVLPSIWLGRPAPARAGNEDPILQGPDAALTSGAVTATTADGAAAYYNPAGIAHIDRGQVNLSAQVIQLQRLEIDDVISVQNGPSADGTVTVLPMLPAGVTYGGKVSDRLSWGGGIFVAQQFAYTLRTALEGGPEAFPVAVNLALEQREINTVAGFGLGYEVRPGLRIGASLLGRYREQYGALVFSTGNPSPSDPDAPPLASQSFVAASDSFGAQSAGVEARIGAQWEPIPELVLAASVWTPTLAIFTAQQETGFEAATVDELGPGENRSIFVPVSVDETRFGLDRVNSWRVRAAVAYQASWGWLALDGDVQPAFRNQSVGVDRDLVWNLRAGGKVFVAQGTAVGFGLFTDRHAIPKGGGELFQPRIHLYGGTFGVSYDDTHRLAADETARKLQFQTGLALRFAYGQGEYSGIQFAADEDSIERLVDARMLELGLYLTSGLFF
ncbi:MAG TPA: hypothetical protein RMF84_00030 [Polyangiaceae bacterium LLY-WYZ-14_1]|nr:hypothetical protein [Polyangiaceae bacterium LLY-WYZ-14_1]